MPRVRHRGALGGEEFVVALPDTTPAEAADVAERIRSAVERTTVCAANGEQIPMTVSIGVASRMQGELQHSLIDRADCAMYAAKTGGRNRVCIAAEPSPHGCTMRSSPVLRAVS